MNQKCGVIYILTNPSFPEYVKIGYANDVKELRSSTFFISYIRNF